MATASHYQLDISVLIHKESQFLLPCLQSIHDTCFIPHKIYLVANSGENETTAKVRRQFPDVTIIVNQQPLGFAANHNQIMATSSSPYIALLNDDLLLEEKSLDILVDFMETHPEAGITGPRLLNPDRSLQPSTYGDPTLFTIALNLLGVSGLFLGNTRLRQSAKKWLIPFLPRLMSRYWEHDRLAEIQVIKGAAMVVRRKALEEVGAMATTTQAFGEEIEWHYRFRKAGWKLFFVPDATMIHYDGQTTGGGFQGSLLVERRKSVLYYFYQHRSLWQGHLIRWMFLLNHTLRWTGTALLGLFNSEWKEHRNTHWAILLLTWQWKR